MHLARRHRHAALSSSARRHRTNQEHSPIDFGGHVMSLRTSLATSTVLLAALLPATAPAQSINPPTAVQTSPAMTEQERRNLAFVLDWWREVIQGGHMDLSSKYQADDYIQHNPNVPTGRAAFVSFFENVV